MGTKSWWRTEQSPGLFGWAETVRGINGTQPASDCGGEKENLSAPRRWEAERTSFFSSGAFEMSPWGAQTVESVELHYATWKTKGLLLPLSYFYVRSESNSSWSLPFLPSFVFYTFPCRSFLAYFSLLSFLLLLLFIFSSFLSFFLSFFYSLNSPLLSLSFQCCCRVFEV